MQTLEQTDRLTTGIPTDASARPASFTQWLRGQTERDDPVGDIARDVVCDPDWPRRAHRFERFEQHLDWLGACSGAIEALARAFEEYEGTPR